MRLRGEHIGLTAEFRPVILDKGAIARRIRRTAPGGKRNCPLGGVTGALDFASGQGQARQKGHLGGNAQLPPLDQDIGRLCGQCGDEDGIGIHLFDPRQLRGEVGIAGLEGLGGQHLHVIVHEGFLEHRVAALGKDVVAIV